MDTVAKGEGMFLIDDVISAKEAGKIMGVNPRTVVRLAERGQLPYFKVGDLWRFRRGDIDTFMRKQLEASQPKEKEALDD